jgi:hypothetical protein
LACPDCGKKYTGQTGRNKKKRYKKHLQSFKTNSDSSKFVQHLVDNRHSFARINDVIGNTAFY